MQFFSRQQTVQACLIKHGPDLEVTQNMKLLYKTLHFIVVNQTRVKLKAKVDGWSFNPLFSAFCENWGCSLDRTRLEEAKNKGEAECCLLNWREELVPFVTSQQPCF